MTILAAVTSPNVNSEPFDFSRIYVVWAGSDRGQCNYAMTDVNENARQLTSTLRENYKDDVGIEVLADQNSPDRCASARIRAAQKAGFHHVRIRPGTNADLSLGIP